MNDGHCSSHAFVQVMLLS